MRTLTFAQAIGVDPAHFLEAIDGGPLNAGYVQLKGKMILDGDFSPSAPLSVMLKDVGLIREAAERAHTTVPLADLIERQFGRAVDAGHGDEDMAATWFAISGEAATD